MFVVVGLAVLVWALAFLDFGRPRPRAEPRARDEPHDAVSGPAPTPTRQVGARPAVSATQPATAETVTPVSAPLAPAAVLAAKAEPYIALRPSPKQAVAPQPTPPPPPPTRGALSTATGEIGEGIMSPEYVEMERTYAHEPRDGAWAEGEEQRLRGLLDHSPLASAVGLVNCQESLCRVLLESDDYDVYSRLLAIPGFTELTGLGPGSAYSHRSGQLSVYFSPRGSTERAR